jgi:hypothetical protein
VCRKGKPEGRILPSLPSQIEEQELGVARARDLDRFGVLDRGAVAGAERLAAHLDRARDLVQPHTAIGRGPVCDALARVELADVDVEIEEGRFGQFDVLLDGKLVASKGGFWRRVTILGAPPQEKLLASIEKHLAVRDGDVCEIDSALSTPDAHSLARAGVRTTPLEADGARDCVQRYGRAVRR